MKMFNTETIIQILRMNKYEYGSISIITLVEVLRGIKAGRRDVKRLLERSFNII